MQGNNVAFLQDTGGSLRVFLSNVFFGKGFIPFMHGSQSVRVKRALPMPAAERMLQAWPGLENEKSSVHDVHWIFKFGRYCRL